MDLLWGSWCELGVSGWGRTHQDWAIDPEHLIVFTAGMGERDPRLRDEAMDWCIRNWRFVTVSRLRNIVTAQNSDGFPEQWGRFAATVNARAGVKWPDATREWTSYKVTGRSVLRPLTDPSLIMLRMRAIFGLSARTEIVRHFVCNPLERATAAMLANATDYQKRNVAEACDLLVQADLLAERQVGNRFYYSLADRRRIRAFVGSVPQQVPDWRALFRVILAIVDVAELADGAPLDALFIAVHDAVSDIAEDLDVLELPAPRRLRGTAIVQEWDEWAGSVMAGIASGAWPDEGDRCGTKVISELPRSR